MKAGPPVSANALEGMLEKLVKLDNVEVLNVSQVLDKYT